MKKIYRNKISRGRAFKQNNYGKWFEKIRTRVQGALSRRVRKLESQGGF